MATVYLHIGAHKTGTTAIQYFLWNNRKALRKKGFLYPDFHLAAHSHGELANIIKPNNHDARFDLSRRRFREDVLSSKYENIILSSEVFLEGQNVAEAAREFFPADCCDVKVIVYLRNQVDWLESVFHEIVRDPYRRYTGTVQGMREYQQGLHDYRNLLAPWIDQFGESAITLCPYETARAERGILSHLLTLLGIDDHKSFDLGVSKENQNLRLHPMASEFLRRVNRYPMLNGEHRALVTALQKSSVRIADRFDGKFRLLDTDTMELLIREFSTSNQDLFDKYSWYGPVSLFEQRPAMNEALHAAAEFHAETQHQVMNFLDPGARSLLERLIPRVANREAGKAFLPPPPSDQEKRLNEIIFRQRFELRRLYQKYGDKG